MHASETSPARKTNGQDLLLSVPFYIYDEFDWLSNSINTTIANYTFAEYVQMSNEERKKHNQADWSEDSEIMFYLSARKHPMRVYNPQDAKLFLLPMLSVYIGWNGVYPGSVSICKNNVCNKDLLREADDLLQKSQWFQKSNGSDHIFLLATFFGGHSKFNKKGMEYRNLRRCNAIQTENGSGNGLIDNDRITYNTFYVASGCTPTLPFQNKTEDVVLVATLYKQKRRMNKLLQDRRNICTWLQHSNFTSKHSMEVCGKGEQCPALSNARVGFHPRGDSYSASRLFHTLLSGTVPIFTLEEQLTSHQSFIDWMKLGFFLK